MGPLLWTFVILALLVGAFEFRFRRKEAANLSACREVRANARALADNAARLKRRRV